ncbi:MAG: hypothetical protein LQ346_001305 [Caloplaca aetnensis]|nr:MAG: hypothetical protein LQ346_001305 [Caloplaca aetnensis]
MDEDDPRFKQASSPYDDPPPPYPSDESTQIPSPEPSDHGRHEAQETVKRFNSTVYYQFQHQKCEEEEELRNHPVRGPFDFNKVATATIIRRWTEQGIWNSEWDPQDLWSAYWKHEEPVELDPGSDHNSPSPPPIFGERQEGVNGNRRKSKRREESAWEETQRQASRPRNQFHYQVVKEQERIGATASVRKKAYENVKQRWIDRGIWDSSWLRFPGMSWKHEKPWRHETPNTTRHVRRGSPIPLDGTSLVPAHGESPPVLRSSTPNSQSCARKLLRNGKWPEKKAPALSRVSDASKAIRKQSRGTNRRTGTPQQPLRRSERILKRDQIAQAISSDPPTPAKAVAPPKSTRRVGSSLSRMGSKPRGLAKGASKLSRQRRRIV